MRKGDKYLYWTDSYNTHGTIVVPLRFRALDELGLKGSMHVTNAFFSTAPHKLNKRIINTATHISLDQTGRVLGFIRRESFQISWRLRQVCVKNSWINLYYLILAMGSIELLLLSHDTVKLC